MQGILADENCVVQKAIDLESGRAVVIKAGTMERGPCNRSAPDRPSSSRLFPFLQRLLRLADLETNETLCDVDQISIGIYDGADAVIRLLAVAFHHARFIFVNLQTTLVCADAAKCGRPFGPEVPIERTT